MSFHVVADLIPELIVEISFMPEFSPSSAWFNAELDTEEIVLTQLEDEQGIDADENGFDIQVKFSIHTKSNFITNDIVYMIFSTRRQKDIFKLKHPEFCAKYFCK